MNSRARVIAKSPFSVECPNRRRVMDEILGLLSERLVGAKDEREADIAITEARRNIETI